MFWLKLNEEKTELLRLGRRNSEDERFSHEFKISIKILGTHCDYNNVRRKKANLDSVLKSMKKVLNRIRRIQIVENFCHTQNYVLGIFNSSFQ